MKKEESNLLSYFDGFFVLTQATQVSLIEDYKIEGDKIRVVRTGLGQPIDLKFNSEIEFESIQTNMLTIAKGEHWRKGIDLLLDVFHLNLLDQNYRLQAVLGVNCPYTVPNGVQNFEYLDLAELICKFQSANMFILPCRFEPYGLVFIEAVRMGLPIVATKNSGLGFEFINSGWPGSIVESDAISIAQGILELKNREPESIENLDILRTKILDSFSWSKMAHDILQEWNLIK